MRKKERKPRVRTVRLFWREIKTQRDRERTEKEKTQREKRQKREKTQKERTQRELP